MDVNVNDLFTIGNDIVRKIDGHCFLVFAQNELEGQDTTSSIQHSSQLPKTIAQIQLCYCRDS